MIQIQAAQFYFEGSQVCLCEAETGCKYFICIMVYTWLDMKHVCYCLAFLFPIALKYKLGTLLD